MRVIDCLRTPIAHDEEELAHPSKRKRTMSVDVGMVVLVVASSDVVRRRRCVVLLCI